MRIRRNAARVIGSTSAFFHLSSPPISAPVAPPAPPAKPAVFTARCELNCSPWDVDADPRIEEEDGRAEETVDEQQPAAAASASASAATSAAVTAETETSDKIEIKNDGKSEAIEAEEMAVTVEEEQNVTDPNPAKKTCNRKGRGWECTRPAEQPHTFCHYHLTILRSYKPGRRPGKNTSVVPGSTANRSPSSGARKRTWKKAARASAAADPRSQIYYSGFAPWSAKRRGGTSPSELPSDPRSQIYYSGFAPGSSKRRGGTSPSEIKIKEDEEGSAGHQVSGLDVLVDKNDNDEHAAEEPLTPNMAMTEASAKNIESDVVYCRKNDGKGWKCKRPAALPSYFCSHHLAQLKTYSSNQYQNNRDLVELKTTAASDASNSMMLQSAAATPDKSKVKKRGPYKKRKSAAATASSSSSSNDFYFSSSSKKDFYYYNKKDAPWRKKSRGARAEVEAQAEEVEAQAEEVKEVEKEENNVRAEKFVKGIIDINVLPSDYDDGYEDGGDGVAQRV